MRQSKWLSILAAMFAAASSLAAINVRDLGAQGDGVADDTEAFRKAATESKHGRLPRSHMMTRHCYGSAEAPFTAIKVPPGTYRITDKVVFQDEVMLLGEPGAVIVNGVRPGEPMFYFRDGFRVIVKAIEFRGGGCDLQQWTRNADRAYLHIADCTFKGATGCAVVSTSFKDPKLEGKVHSGVPSIETPWYEKDAVPYNNSTLIIVERCRFEDNRIAFHAWSDGVTVRDCSFIAPPCADSPQIIAGNGGRMGVELFYRDLTFDFSRGVKGDPGVFRFEGGRMHVENVKAVANGNLSFIHSVAHYCDYGTPTTIAVRGIDLDLGTAPVVRIEGERGINRISVYDVASAHRGVKKMIEYGKEPSEESIDYWMDHAQTMRCIPAESIFGFAFCGYAPKRFDISLPKALEKYRRQAPAKKWKRPFSVKSGAEFAKFLPGGKVFKAPDNLGTIQMKQESSDREAIQKLLDEAAAAGGGIVELPARWLHVGQTLVIPPGVRLSCRGRAAIMMKDEKQPIFKVVSPGTVGFENILFGDGLHAFESGLSKGAAIFVDCAFGGQLGASIQAHAQKPGRYSVFVTGGQAGTAYLYRGNAKMAIDAFWYQEMAERPKGVINKEYSAIVNEPGGKLLLREMLGVPCYFVHYPKEVAYNRSMPELEGEYRWVDNYGILSSVNTRYGGEWGGISPVYHFGGAAVTYLEGGTVEFGNAYCKGHRSVVTCDVPDAKVTMVDAASSIPRFPFRAYYKRGEGDYVPVKGQRRAMNFIYGDLAPLWVAGEERGSAGSYVFSATYDYVPGKNGTRIELETDCPAQVFINGKRVANAKGSALKEFSVIENVSFQSKEGRNEISVVVPASGSYLALRLISGEHDLVHTGLESGWKAVDDHGTGLTLEERFPPRRISRKQYEQEIANTEIQR